MRLAMCPEHRRLCAYTGTEPDRCPWCHATWGRILSSGYHSCEVASVWSKDKAGREVPAAAMRREAAVKVGRRPRPVSVDPGATATLLGPVSSVSPW